MMAWAADPTVIAAAADLNFALTEASDLFAKESGKPVKIAFGSSGNFACQIAWDGPFEMGMSADESYVHPRYGHPAGYQRRMANRTRACVPAPLPPPIPRRS